MLEKEAIDLLKQLIAIPSFSKDEFETGNSIEAYMKEKGVDVKRYKNNVWASNKFYDKAKPTILLNSHHDTVKPNKSYTHNPFQAIEKDGKLYGLGSNDAGGALVSLLATFLHFYDKENLKYNLVYAATAEEEISGKNGIAVLLKKKLLGDIDFAIVGEPTQMQLAIAEKGIVVIDCTAKGVAGHAAREEGVNAIYKAMKDIEWFMTFKFPKVSPLLGPVKMTVTVIKAGKHHNVIPDRCEFLVDVRVNECYTNEEVVAIIKEHIKCDVEPRSVRLQSSFIAEEHPVVVAGKSLGLKTYGSPTISDRALMPFTSLKMGPGDSARSHTADEYIYIDEIKSGINTYIKVLEKIL